MAGTLIESDRVEEQRHQDVLQGAQRNIRPAGQKEVTAKGAPADPPEPFREGADRAQPPAKRLAEQEGDRQEGHQQKHARGMDGGEGSGEQKHLQVHQRRDRQPAFDTGRTGDQRRGAERFIVPDEEVELDADPDVQQQESALHAPTQKLRMIGCAAFHELLRHSLPGYGRSGRGAVTAVTGRGRGRRVRVAARTAVPASLRR